ncbi:hypothetical protein ACHAXA_009675 [Cyclostephanos tholiformis]|uniref:Uncharacterized protein n=1 Tax=Cyclostephanos tholiformis TaxID=382380 RepID=A0ABD3RNJ6_9STRA
MAPFKPQRVLEAAIAINFPQASCFIAAPNHPSYRLTLSAHSSRNDRRDFLRTVATTTFIIAATVPSVVPSVANAAYGASSNIVMPNYIEYLIEKNQQIDPGDLIYKGPDVETQLRRIGEAGNRFPEIATLAEEKKWSQVQGIITGPLGTLLQTMNAVVGIAGTKEAKDAAKLVKTDLLEIGVAAGRKESAQCVKAADKAAEDLAKFVNIAFK